MNSTEHSIRRSRASRAKVGLGFDGGWGVVGEDGSLDGAAAAAAPVEEEEGG